MLYTRPTSRGHGYFSAYGRNTIIHHHVGARDATKNGCHPTFNGSTTRGVDHFGDMVTYTPYTGGTSGSTIVGVKRFTIGVGRNEQVRGASRSFKVVQVIVERGLPAIRFANNGCFIYLDLN